MRGELRENRIYTSIISRNLVVISNHVRLDERDLG